MSEHAITRVRQETRRRTLTVSNVEALSPHMKRVVFASPELRDFSSAAPDDHIKLFFSDAGEPCMRDFTPRAFDRVEGTLVVDFALHAAGPASTWAANARVGQTLDIGGPRGSMVVPDDYDWYLLIGDESALPAIGRRVEELRPNVSVATFVAVDSAADAQSFPTRAAWTPNWVCRDIAGDDDSASLRRALCNYTFPAGDGFIWVAAESRVARDVRNYVVDERGHPREWLKAASYWKQGEADSHERI